MVHTNVAKGPRFFKSQPQDTGCEASIPASSVQVRSPPIQPGPPPGWTFRPSFGPHIPSNPSNRESSTAGWRKGRSPVQATEDSTPIINTNDLDGLEWIIDHIKYEALHAAEQQSQVGHDISYSTTHYTDYFSSLNGSTILVDDYPTGHGYPHHSTVDHDDPFVARCSSYLLQVPQSALTTLGTDRPEGFVLRYLRSLAPAAADRQQGVHHTRTHRLSMWSEPPSPYAVASPFRTTRDEFATHPRRTACRSATAEGLRETRPGSKASGRCLTASTPGCLCACNVILTDEVPQKPNFPDWPPNWVHADLVEIETASVEAHSSQPVDSQSDIFSFSPTASQVHSFQHGPALPAVFYKPIQSEPTDYLPNVAEATAFLLRGAAKYEYMGDFITQLIQFKHSLNLSYCRYLELSVQHCRSEQSRLQSRAERTEMSVRNGRMSIAKQNDIIARGSVFLLDCGRTWDWTEQQRLNLIAWDDAKGPYRCDCCEGGRPKSTTEVSPA